MMPVKHKLAGQRFGKWVALAPVKGRGWMCHCDCGERRIVKSTDLADGSSRQCKKCCIKDRTPTVEATKAALLKGCSFIMLPNGEFTLVDKEDVARLQHYRWYSLPTGYVASSMRQGSVYLHRLLLNAPPEMEVDHKNHNKRDNRKGNLRLCTSQQNNAHRVVAGNSTSRFKGVHRNGNRFAAHGAGKHLGNFKTPEEAARVYNIWALERYGEFACLNQI